MKRMPLMKEGQQGQMPPNGQIPMGGQIPPNGQMPPDGSQMAEVMRAIMPDFPKWNRFFFRLDCVFVFGAFILKCIFFVYYLSYGNDVVADGMEMQYFLRHALIPTLPNVLILAVAFILKRRLPQNDMRQNVIPVFALLVIDIIVCMADRIFLVVLCVFCIPICMTTVFSSKKMCRLTTNVSIIGSLIAIVKQFIITEPGLDRTLIIPQGIIVIVLLITLGKVVQTALSMTDGQKQKLMTYAINIKEEQKHAEAANIAKSAFLANMSHEIRTPINAILGMNEMILRENTNEQITGYAESIDAAGNSLLYLVNDVLDFSKIESGKLEIVKNVYETPSFIQNCCSMIAEKAEKKGLELNIDCNPNLPSRLRGDESRLRQIVTNLLSNAVKYTEKGSVTLSFDSGGIVEQEDGHEKKMLFIITVRDTGIGIKEEDIGKLFSQFTRVDLRRNRNIEGSGLGLAITKNIVDLMHGDIRVQSIYGVGSSFTVTIPQQIIDETPVGDLQEQYRNARKGIHKYEQSFEAPDAKILIVDDMEVNLKVIVSLLKATKIKVDTAISGKKCLSMIAENAYDIIFMDHMMPEMDGVETYNEMKKLENSINKNTPVIMLTANAVTGVKEKFLQAGFSDYLSKPVSSEKLEKMIIKYLDKGKVHMSGGQNGSALSENSAGYTSETETAKSETPANAGSASPADIFGKDSSDNLNKLQDLFQIYPKIDFSYVLSVCGKDSEIYVDILKTFAEDLRAEALNTYYEQKDVENYQILVHGIKSSSKSVGFMYLSEKAKELEDAAREKNWDFINGQHNALIEEYQKAVNAINEALGLTH